MFEIYWKNKLLSKKSKNRLRLQDEPDLLFYKEKVKTKYIVGLR